MSKTKVPRPIADYKIGDELFRYVDVGGVFRWIVVGIRQYEGETQLEIESQSCTHGWKCRVLVARDDYERIHAVHMLNEEEEDRQRHWHSNDGYGFWPTSAEAKAEKVRKMIRDADDRLRKAKDALAAAEKHRAELVGLEEAP